MVSDKTTLKIGGEKNIFYKNFENFIHNLAENYIDKHLKVLKENNCSLEDVLKNVGSGWFVKEGKNTRLLDFKAAESFFQNWMTGKNIPLPNKIVETFKKMHNENNMVYFRTYLSKQLSGMFPEYNEEEIKIMVVFYTLENLKGLFDKKEYNNILVHNLRTMGIKEENFKDFVEHKLKMKENINEENIAYERPENILLN